MNKNILKCGAVSTCTLVQSVLDYDILICNQLMMNIPPNINNAGIVQKI